MIFVLLIYFGLCLFKSKITFKGTADYLAIGNTNCVKGIFILMVFLSHFNSYVELNGRFDSIYVKFFAVIAQGMVTMFLFYSGYGIMESIKKKGDAYVSGIPFKRILATLFRFDIAIVLFFILSLITKYPLTVKKVLLSLIGWDAIGNSNWYIFVVLVLYLVTYLVFKIAGTKNLLLSTSITGFVILLLVVVTAVFEIKAPHWYDTALCYWFGMFYSLYKEKIVKVVNHNLLVWLVFTGGSFLAYLVLKDMGTVLYLIANLLFTSGFLILTMRLTFNNKVLKWSGEHLFEIYILQRIPMIIFKDIVPLNTNIYMYFILCVAITVLLTIGFKVVTDFMWQKLTIKKA